MEDNFNPSDFDFYQKQLMNKQNAKEVPEVDTKEGIVNTLLHLFYLLALAVGAGLTGYLFKTNLYVADPDNGGIGVFGMVLVFLFFFVLLLDGIASFCYRIAFSGNAKKEATFEKIHNFTLYFSFLGLFVLYGVVLMRPVVLTNDLSGPVWGYLGYVMAGILGAVSLAFAILSIAKPNAAVKNIGYAFQGIAPWVLVCNYRLLATTISVTKDAMWLVIVGCVLVDASVVVRISGKKKAWAYTGSSVLLFLAFLLFALAAIQHGLNIPYSF